MDKVIGVDLGGTSINVGLMNINGQILQRSSRSTRSGQNRAGVLILIKDLITELFCEEVIGIGVGSPGCIDSEKGKVLEIGGNIEGWAGTDIRKELSDSFPSVPIFIDNDANVAAYCEEWIGAAKSFSTFVMLTLGTGVGGALMTEKDGILKGHHFQGGELGHAILYPHGEQCNCGQKGCVDRYISGKSLERHYIELTGTEKKGFDIFRSMDEDQVSHDLVVKYCKDLAIYLVSLKNIFDSEVIIIGGGVINSRNYWWDMMIEFFHEFANNSDGMQIVPAMYLNDAGMIGAGKIVFEKLGYLINN